MWIGIPQEWISVFAENPLIQGAGALPELENGWEKSPGWYGNHSGESLEATDFADCSALRPEVAAHARFPPSKSPFPAPGCFRDYRMHHLKKLTLLILPAMLYCSTPGGMQRDSRAEDPSVAGTEATAATQDWLYGSWTMDKEKTVRRMLQVNGQDFDSYSRDQQQTIMEQFNLDLRVDLAPSSWNAEFREGARSNSGKGKAEYTNDGDTLIVSMTEVLDDGTVKVDRLQIYRLGPDLLRMRFIEESEDVSFILERQ
ncbi:MAG: hypothetical protein CMN76_10870 [Spirochaetaceae bacterium]|nr:hypothetical protein [Spirochaetaceae bacterium]